MARAALLVALTLLAASSLAADDAAVFPGAEWEHVQPSEAAFDEARLDALRVWLRTQRTTGLIVVAGGRVVFEHGDVTGLSKVASVRKSVLAMLYGRYVEDGTIDLERTIKDVGLEDLTPYLAVEEGATLHHLLMARSGVYLPSGNEELTVLSPRRGSYSPGTYFQYQNWDFNAAGAAFEKLTGRDIYDALESDLARPIRMQDFDRARQRKGDSAPDSNFDEYKMYLSARDMARLGLLMLRRGNWNGAQLVPAAWIDEMTTLVTPQARHSPCDLGPGIFEPLGLRVAVVGVGCAGTCAVPRRDPMPAPTRRWAPTANTSPCCHSSTWSSHIKWRSRKKTNGKIGRSLTSSRGNTTRSCS